MGDIVEVSVNYTKGDYRTKRGIYVHVTPKTLEQRDGYVAETCLIYGGYQKSGFKIFAGDLKRFVPSKVLEVADHIDNVAIQITEQALAGNSSAAASLVWEAIDDLLPKDQSAAA
jgi:hypothetical protein